MSIPWYYLLAYILFGVLLLWIFDKYQIIKPKTLRYFAVIIVYTLLCWGIYDLLISEESKTPNFEDNYRSCSAATR